MHPKLAHYQARLSHWAKRSRLKVHRHLPGFLASRIAPPPNQRLLACATKLMDTAHALPEFVTEMEARFLAVGTGLEEKSELASRLVKESEELVAFVVGNNGGEGHLHTTVTTLEQPLAFIDDCLTKAGRLATRLKHHEKQLEAVRGLEDTLNKTIAPLKFIQTLFKVESASLPESVRAIFIGLTNDIEQLHLRVAEIFNEHFHTLARSHSVVLELIGRLELHVARQSQAVEEKKASIRLSLDTLQRDMGNNDQRDVRLANSSRAISEQASKVVMGLQYQDITRQKLEHIAQAIEALQARLDALETPGVDYETEASQQDLLYIKETCSLQASHLLTVLADITAAETDVRDGLVALRGRTQDLDRECLELQNFKSVSAAEDGMVQVLLDIIHSVRHLVDDTLKLQQDLYETIRPLGGLATNLTSTMRTISNNIKLIALNAQVQAAHTGQGTGLEVLAEGTCRISDETYQFNETTAADLDAFIWGLDNIISECAGICEQGAVMQAYLEKEGSAAEAQLHAYRDATLAAMLQVGTTSDAVDQKSQEVQALCSFAEVVQPRVQALFETLQGLYEACDDLLLRSPDGKTARLTEHLKPNYTMASERAVHSALDVGQAGALAEAANEATFDAFDDKVLLDSVDAFPVLPDVQTIAEKHRQERLAATAAQPSPAPVAKKAPAEAELADNVELF